MAFAYLGTSARAYTQYRDLSTDQPLLAEPGGAYDMAPVPGWEDSEGVSTLAVPPSDGLWGTGNVAAKVPEPPSAEPAADAAPAEDTAAGKPAKTTKAAAAVKGD